MGWSRTDRVWELVDGVRVVVVRREEVLWMRLYNDV